MAPNYDKPETIFIRGKVKWHRARTPNQYDKYSTQCYPIKEDLEVLREMQATDGIKNTIKKDDDGYYITFTRPLRKETRMGKVLVFKPPYVTDKDNAPFDGNVGNGSDATIELEKYSYNVPNSEKKGKALRWMGSRIDNLVPYDVEDYKPDEYAIIQRSAAQPVPLWN